jgi:predicted transcriptional regulator
MQHLIDIGEIKVRGEAIGFRLGRLARMAGLDPATAYRGANGDSETRTSNLRKLLETLERQEARVRRHLRDLERSGGGRQFDFIEERKA